MTNPIPYAKGTTPVKDPLKNMPQIRTTIKNVVDRYGEHSMPVLRELSLLIMRSTPPSTEILLPKTDKFIAMLMCPDLKEEANLLASMLKLQNVGSPPLSHDADFRNQLSQTMREATTRVADIRANLAKKVEVLRTEIGAPAGRALIAQSKQGIAYTPWVMTVKEPFPGESAVRPVEAEALTTQHALVRPQASVPRVSNYGLLRAPKPAGAV